VIHKAIVLSAGTAIAFAAGAAHANHIDFMTDGPFTLNGASSTTVSGSPDNILGGQRFVSMDTVDAIAQLNPGDNFITFDGLGAATPTLTLSYGDFGGGTPLNADFASMWDMVTVTFASVTGSGLLSVEFESGSGSGTSAQTLVGAAGSYSFGFDEPVFNGVDFSDIDTVTLTLSATIGSEFAIESFTREVIPAPGAAALLALGGVAAFRRRR
jgi:hypothetical protein